MKAVLTAAAMACALISTSLMTEDANAGRKKYYPNPNHGQRDAQGGKGITFTDGTVIGGIVFRRMTCDFGAGGAARLDTCAPDGMAAGGSNSGSRNHKKR